MNGPHALRVHEPLLVNLLGHSAGALLFGMFLVLAARDRGRQRRLSLMAAGLALCWHVGSLVVLGQKDSQALLTEWVVVLSTSALSLLPAVLLHLLLGGEGAALRWCGYGLSAVTVVLHVFEPVLDRPELHRTALALSSLGFAALTVFAARRRVGPARWAAPMAIFVFALSFEHLHPEGASQVWPVELLLHHAGVPLALFVLLQDYRFVLVDAFLRLVANLVLAAAFTFAAARMAEWAARAEVRTQALALVGGCVLLIAFALARQWLQALLTRTVFRQRDTRQVLAELRAEAARHESAEAYLNWARGYLADVFDAEEGEAEMAMVIAPGYDLVLGRRRGGRRYLSEDREALMAYGAELTEQYRRFREAELRQLAAQAELRALQSQINPHFLFNAFNTIYGIIPREAANARRTVLNLADIFRYFLRQDKAHLPLAEEVAIVRAYLEIEQVRLGDKLRVAIDVTAEAERMTIPALSVQPLVENAVKHGVAPYTGGGEVRLTARVEGGELMIEVEDRGIGPARTGGLKEEHQGVSLQNVVRRLELHYGSAAALTREKRETGMTVTMRLPARSVAPVGS